jgi:hypothetical protein
MQKEEMIVVVLLLMALGSLAIARMGVWRLESRSASGKPDFTISVEGRVLDLKTTKTGGNLVVPSNSDAKKIQSRIHSNIASESGGKLPEFNGKQEIKVLGWQRCRVNQVVVRSDGRA